MDFLAITYLTDFSQKCNLIQDGQNYLEKNYFQKNLMIK